MIGLGLCTAIFTIRSEDEIASDAAALGLRDGAEQLGVIHGILAGTESGKSAFADFSTSTAERVLEVVKETFVAGVQLSCVTPRSRGSLVVAAARRQAARTAKSPEPA